MSSPDKAPVAEVTAQEQYDRAAELYAQLFESVAKLPQYRVPKQWRLALLAWLLAGQVPEDRQLCAVINNNLGDAVRLGDVAAEDMTRTVMFLNDAVSMWAWRGGDESGPEVLDHWRDRMTLHKRLEASVGAITHLGKYVGA